MKWTEAYIKEFIASVAVDGVASSQAAGMTACVMARRRFGSWVDACRAAGVRAATDRKRYVTCVVDGCETRTRSRACEYCEKHYYRLRRNGTLDTMVDMGRYDSCVYCDRPSNGSKYCSARCRCRHDRGTPRFRECVACGAAYEPLNDGIDPVTCSEDCAAEHARRLGRKRYQRGKKIPEFMERIRAAEYKRKALKKEAFVDEFTRQEIMDRDNWICGICGDPVDPDAEWPDPGFGSVDHIIPLSRGGEHSRANVQCAHLSCNCKKGNKIEQ